MNRESRQLVATVMALTALAAVGLTVALIWSLWPLAVLSGALYPGTLVLAWTWSARIGRSRRNAEEGQRPDPAALKVEDLATLGRLSGRAIVLLVVAINVVLLLLIATGSSPLVGVFNITVVAAVILWARAHGARDELR
jgi:hypothetical protein